MPDESIACFGYWTHWVEVHFGGRTVQECLEIAMKAKQEYDDKEC